MKKEEINYERWLGQLKKTPPILENPEALTEDIMRAVKAASFRSPAKRRPNLVAWCSGIAATLLLAIWIAETMSVDSFPSSEVIIIPEPYQSNTFTDSREHRGLTIGEKQELFFYRIP
ncbi:hypothetical protein ACRASS_12295 [Bacteroides hominis]|uniref:hypothetical protein n=1 Tax=Bacteroides hominis TaxID=2763023 RepID=UPI003D6A0467